MLLKPRRASRSSQSPQLHRSRISNLWMQTFLKPNDREIGRVPLSLESGALFPRRTTCALQQSFESF
jgi:hypothetical protein